MDRQAEIELLELEKIIDRRKHENRRKLTINEKQLRSLPESIGKLYNYLTELDVSRNQLDNLPGTIGQLKNLVRLDLSYNQLENLPDSIGQLKNLVKFDLNHNHLKSLPESIGQLTKLTEISLGINQLTSLPDSIGQLTNLTTLSIYKNQIGSLPESFDRLTNLTEIYLGDNPLTDLSILQSLHKLKSAHFLGVHLSRRYWTKLSDWKSEWLLDEYNAEVRRLVIKQIGYERMCQELDAIAIDSWREYTLLKIEDFQEIYDEDRDEIDYEPLLLLKMTCPSTAHIHILRVPPKMTSAEGAITWVNHGIHPDTFAVQT
jgi:leucine-rich repeat protein SHOC2